MSVEVERVASAQLTIDHLPRLVQPAFWRRWPPLKDNVVALQSTREVVPCSCHKSVLAAKVLDELSRRRLNVVSIAVE